MKGLNFTTSLLLIILCLTNLSVYAQDNQSLVDIGADVMSRYVWRGLDYGASPSIQPYIELAAGDFAIGAWGAYTTNSPGVQEMDLYASYTIKDIFSVGLTDYFFPNEVSSYDYFNYSADYQHVIEGVVSFNGTDNLPLSIMAGVNLVNDPDNSLYVEMGYSLSVLNIFLGAGNGLYTIEAPGDDDVFGIVNLGIGISKDIPVNDNYSIPISASLITNPQAKGIHLVFGISF